MRISVLSSDVCSSDLGGTLVLTPLRGADGQIYAMAQGNLAVGGLGVDGADGSKLSDNIPSAGRIPGGASVEQAVATGFADSPSSSEERRVGKECVSTCRSRRRTQNYKKKKKK